MVNEGRSKEGRVLRTRFSEKDSREFFEKEYPPLYRYAFYLTGDQGLAEDICQETFIRWFSLERPDEIEMPRAWLKKVLSRLAISNYRHQKVRNNVETRLADDQIKYVDRGFEQLEVEDILSHLPWRDQILLKMKMAGLSYQEMAEAAGIAPGSVGTLLARAYKKVRQEYSAEGRSQTHGMSRPGKIVTLHG